MRAGLAGGGARETKSLIPVGATPIGISISDRIRTEINTTARPAQELCRNCSLCCYYGLLKRMLDRFHVHQPRKCGCSASVSQIGAERVPSQLCAVRNRVAGDVESVSRWVNIGKSQSQARTGAGAAWLVRLLVVMIVAFATPSHGRADDHPSFADLLLRAQSQAALGHRWSPPGNNMTETIEMMMDRLSTATPKQLADLSALLEADPPHAATPPPQAQIVQPVATETALAPQPVAPKPPAAIAPEPVTPEPVASEPVASEPVASEPVAPKPPAAPVVIRPGPRAADLFARGQDAERQGDVSGARRLYATAADQGSATAARSLGRLYDPGYLKQTAFGGIDPDPALARHWYERAVAMGDAQAAPLLQALAAR
jgi:hypothetical protein